MHISSCVYHKESDVLKLCNVYIIKCSSQGKMLQSYAMYISLCAYKKERCFGAARCIYHQVVITRRDVLKLHNVYIIMCSSQGKMF